MTSTTTPAPFTEYCSTRQAANLLQVSLGTAQKMVERGELEAWKTQGGHRRILVSSVLTLLRQRTPASHARTLSDPLSVVVAEDDPVTQSLYCSHFSNWNLALDLRMTNNGFEGLIEIGRSKPDLLITDLKMPHLDGYAMLRTLRATATLAEMDIVVVTAVETAEIQAAGGLPADTTLLRKPVPFNELYGYLQALAVRRRRLLSSTG